MGCEVIVGEWVSVGENVLVGIAVSTVGRGVGDAFGTVGAEVGD